MDLRIELILKVCLFLNKHILGCNVNFLLREKNIICREYDFKDYDYVSTFEFNADIYVSLSVRCFFNCCGVRYEV